MTVDDDRRRALYLSLTPRSNSNLGILLHAANVYGDQIPLSDGKKIRLTEVLLGRQQLPGSGRFDIVAFKTQHGASFALYDERLEVFRGRASESHRGQALSILAGLGVTREAELHLSGETFRVEELLDDVAANYSYADESYWETLSLARLQPEVGLWKNKFGEEFTFEGAAMNYLERPVWDGPCCGVHRLEVLAELLTLSKRYRILSSQVTANIETELDRCVQLAVANQSLDGSWEFRWDLQPDAGRKSGPNSGTTSTLERRILATGHLVEWMSKLDESTRPEREVFGNAVHWIYATLTPVIMSDSEWVNSNYCPLSHAVKVA